MNASTNRSRSASEGTRPTSKMLPSREAVATKAAESGTTFAGTVGAALLGEAAEIPPVEATIGVSEVGGLIVASDES